MAAEDVKSGPVITAAEVKAKRAQLAECEKRIETAFRSAFYEAGLALEEVRGGRLYLLALEDEPRKTFAAYLEKRWELSESQGYRLIEAARLVERLSLPPQVGEKKCPPPALESHARALSAAPVHLQARVWADVWQQTGGRPTAKAVEAAARQAAREFEATRPRDEAESAAFNAAYAPFASKDGEGGDFHAGLAAGHEAVRRYREEHGLPAAPAAPDAEPAAPDQKQEQPAPGGPGGDAQQLAPVPAAAVVAEQQVQPPGCGYDVAWHERAASLAAYLSEHGFEWDGKQIVKKEA